MTPDGPYDYDEGRGPGMHRRCPQRLRPTIEAAAENYEPFYYRADWQRFCPQVPEAPEWEGGDRAALRTGDIPRARTHRIPPPRTALHFSREAAA